MELDQIEQAIKNAGLYTYLGRIGRIMGTTMESMGFTYRPGDVCTINVVEGGSPVMAEVVGFRENRVLLIPYGEAEGIGYSSVVRGTEERLHITVSNHPIGRTVSAVGSPIDDLRPVEDVSYYPITGKPSSPMTRPRIDTIIQMGVKVVDGLMTVGKGQRMGISTGSDVGKSTLMGMIAKSVKADVSAIALVGGRSREVVKFIHRDLGEEGLRRSVLVIAIFNQSAMICSKCTTTATTTAEYFRGQGIDVLLMMDFPIRFAMTQREVGPSTGKPPVARGCTPSIYSELPKLLERSDNSEERSVTGIYMVLAERDGANESVSDTARGIIDGHIMLSRKMVARNHYPAISILPSISRLMNDIVTPEHKAAAGKLRGLLSVYESNRDLVFIGVYKKGANLELDDILERVDRIYGSLQRRASESFSLNELVIQIIQAID